jgi:hypothetical protein
MRTNRFMRGACVGILVIGGVLAVTLAGGRQGVGLSVARGDEKLAGIACRSVHLGYRADKGTAFYIEVTVDKSAPGTYFMVCGWHGGYYGIQELGDGKKQLIFSVWDSEQNDPKAVAEEKRVKLVHRDPAMRIGRFGGEGTGGQSFLSYDWRVGQTYRFLVTSCEKDGRTEYAGYFYDPEPKHWRHLVTFSTPKGGGELRGYYSFVEDFKRDRRSCTFVRKAHYGNGWVQVKGEWVKLTKARFTADSNPARNIDAGADRFFWLSTGGDTRDGSAALRSEIELPAEAKHVLPEDLPTK